MNKTELINALAEASNISKKQSSKIVNDLSQIILDEMSKHSVIKITGLGTFKVSEVKAKTVTNPQSGKKIDIKAHHRVRFVPGQALKDAANKNNSD